MCPMELKILSAFAPFISSSDVLPEQFLYILCRRHAAALAPERRP